VRNVGVVYNCIAGPVIYDAPRIPETAPHYCVRANDVCRWTRMGLENVSCSLSCTMGGTPFN
jgi:hypothetical protein